MSAAGLDYRDQFLTLLNNRDKSRQQGFVVFVHGSSDLEPLESICFSDEQTYNRCFTVRYGAAGMGDFFTSTIRQFIVEAQVIVKKAPTRLAKQQKAAPSSSELTGIFQPIPPESTWGNILESVAEVDFVTYPSFMEHYFSILRSTLQVGERLVLFCELSNCPEDATLQDLGFTEETFRYLLQLPERFGFVLSGVPSGLALSGLSNAFLDLEAGPDYGRRVPPPQRSQPLRNDSPFGEDRLQITSEVNALADAIAGKDMDPPLVVGILGGWGTGKSFILQLLQERLRFLRNQKLINDAVRSSNPYVGHPYLVRFDAWTYAKSDLWASLMDRILFDLDQQLNLEQTVAAGGVDLRGGFDLWEIISNSTSGQLDALAQDLGQEAIDLIKDWKMGRGTATALWSALEKLRAEELERLQTAKDELASQQKVGEEALRAARVEADQKLLEARQKNERELAERYERHKASLSQKQAELEAARAQIRVDVEREIEALARREAWVPVLEQFKSFFGAVADRVLKEGGWESAGAPASVWQVEKEIGLAAKYWKGLWNSPYSLAFFIFAILSSLFLWVLNRNGIDSMMSTMTGFTGMVGGAVASVYAGLAKVNRWFEERQALYEEKMQTVRVDKADLRESLLARKHAELIAPQETAIQALESTFAVEIKALEETQNEGFRNLKLAEATKFEEIKTRNEADIQVLKEKVEEHARRAGIPGQSKSLTELIQKRIESGYYHERLGILHQVQNDLQEITEALLPIQGYDEKLFPRGAPRIILFIDDLDRCPPRQVVQVLEAAQLLVKTRLFVVVIAMDVRYITRALEKEYEGILVREGSPSGLDYTEKIVQIPYRVRPISKGAMSAYLLSQIVLKQELPAGHATPGGAGEIHSSIVITAPGQATARVNEAIPPEIQQFDPVELRLLEMAAVSVEISPRATKRLINVMKLIKNIWYRKGLSMPALSVERAMILLLTLSASHPETMARILNELERGYRELTANAQTQNLKAALQAIVERWSTHEGIAEDWAMVSRLIQDDELLDADLALELFGLENLQMVRSFSFLGEVDMPLIEKTKKHAVEILGANGRVEKLLKPTKQPGPRRNKSNRS